MYLCTTVSSTTPTATTDADGLVYLYYLIYIYKSLTTGASYSAQLAVQGFGSLEVVLYCFFRIILQYTAILSFHSPNVRLR